MRKLEQANVQRERISFFSARSLSWGECACKNLLSLAEHSEGAPCRSRRRVISSPTRPTSRTTRGRTARRVSRPPSPRASIRASRAARRPAATPASCRGAVSSTCRSDLPGRSAPRLMRCAQLPHSSFFHFTNWKNEENSVYLQI